MNYIEKELFTKEQVEYNKTKSNSILIIGIDTFDYTYKTFRCEPNSVDNKLKTIYNKDVWVDVIAILDLTKDFENAEVKA